MSELTEGAVKTSIPCSGELTVSPETTGGVDLLRSLSTVASAELSVITDLSSDAAITGSISVALVEHLSREPIHDGVVEALTGLIPDLILVDPARPNPVVIPNTVQPDVNDGKKVMTRTREGTEFLLEELPTERPLRGRSSARHHDVAIHDTASTVSDVSRVLRSNDSGIAGVDGGPAVLILSSSPEGVQLTELLDYLVPVAPGKESGGEADTYMRDRVI